MDTLPNSVRRFATLCACIALLTATFRADAADPLYPPSATSIALTFEQPYDGAGFEAASGIWQQANGTYNSSAVGHADLATIAEYYELHPASPPSSTLPFEEYTLGVRVQNQFGASGNLAGLVYGYQDALNYSEVVISPNGTVQLRFVTNGAIRVVASSAFPEGGRNAWVDIELVRSQGMSAVKINGLTRIAARAQTVARGRIGFVTHWSRARFDNLAVTVPVGLQPFRQTFSAGTPADWSVVSGTWNTTGGVLRTSSIQRDAIMLMPISTSLHTMVDFSLRVRMMNPYGASGNRVGIVYNYRGPDNYRELTLTPTGIARLQHVTSSGTTIVAAASYPGVSKQWLDVQFILAFSQVTVLVDGVEIFNDVYAIDPASYPDGAVGLVSHWTPGQFDDVDFGYHYSLPYSQTFSDPASTFNVKSGIWRNYGGQYFGNEVGSGTDIVTLACPCWSTDLRLRAQVFNTSTDPQSTIGMVFSYQPNGDHYEVTTSPAGVVAFDKVVQGVRTRIATGSYLAGSQFWSTIEVIRSGVNTSVRVDGSTVISNAVHAQLGEGEFGFVARGGAGRFDNVQVSGLPR